METNINYTVVGAFVIALVIFLSHSVLFGYLAGFSDQYTPYQVFMKESVSGLGVDSSS